MPARQLPVSPDVHQVKREARELFRALLAGDSSAVADFHEFGAATIDATNARLSEFPDTSQRPPQHQS